MDSPAPSALHAPAAPLAPPPPPPMPDLPGYRIERRIYEGSRTVVYRGVQVATRTPVVVKLAAGAPPHPAVLARLRHEFRLASSLDVEGVIRVLALERLGSGLALVEEDFGGVSLREVLAEGPLAPARFLDVALRLTSILGRIHARDVVHKDVNPKNILVNRATGAVKVIDFGLASRVSGQVEDADTPAGLEGTLAYISPEQTGRMNRQVDARSDLYSLGVTFFEMLTGSLPFPTTDRAELVHCHLARRPPAAADGSPAVPRVLSDIVAKLLSKAAEDRYQTAAGLEADLASCTTALNERGWIDEFPLGRSDFPDRFQVSKRLYGREEQIAALNAAFSRTAQGYKELVLVAGLAGVGKTSLIRELTRTVAEQHGCFIAGKFDQYKRDIPYGALIDAFQGLVREVLARGEEDLARTRDDLLAALGPNGRVIIDLIPEVERVTGPQPPVPELPPAESHNRLNLAFHNFISVFARRDHPLALFLDDLQWADNASLNLLRMLMTGAETQYLLALGAYRDNEVDAAHPMTATLKEVRAAGTAVRDLALPPLALPDVAMLLADTLRSAPDRVRPLAELIHMKTGGNPFFIGEVLKTVHERRLVTFERETGSWAWDLQGIQALPSSENVVDLMVEKIRRMRPEAQQAVKLAAIIGSQFDAATLALASGKAVGEVLAALREAVVEGMIVLVGEAYRFVELDRQELADGLLDSVLLQSIDFRFAHDKIQQAACSLVPPEAAGHVHRKVGTILLSSTPPDRLERRIFDVVNQLNAALALVTTTADADEVAALNLRAGRRARASAAFLSALNYFETGIRLLRDDPWTRAPRLALDLHTGAAEAARLAGRHDAMDAYVQEVIDRTTRIEDQVAAYEVRIHGYIAQARKMEAISTGLDVLARLGVRIPPAPGTGQVLVQLARTTLALAGKSPEDLLELPPMRHANMLTAMRLMTSLASTAYVVSPNLFPVLVCRQVELSARHGNAPHSPFCYALYGTINCGVLHRIDLGYRFGRLAMRLQDRAKGAEALVPRSAFTYIATVQHFREPLADTLGPFRETCKLSLELGDFEFAGCNGGVLNYHLFFSGVPLHEVEPEVAGCVEMLEQVGQEAYLSYSRLYLEAIRELMTVARAAPNLSGPVFDAEPMLAHYRDRSDSHGAFNVWLVRGILAYLFGRSAEAVAHFAEARKHLFSAAAMFSNLAFRFWESLARLAVCDGAAPDARRRHLLRVASNQRHLARLARHCPASHLHKWHLVRAELARVRHDPKTAAQAYDTAIDRARDSGYTQEEALASELAARFWQSQDRVRVARTYMGDAVSAWGRWGAAAKVAWLEATRPDLVPPAAIAEPAASETTSHGSGARTTSTSSGKGRDGLDLVAVLKASQVMSGEIRLNRLLERMMAIVVENAGAERGLLILESDGKLFLEAESTPDAEAVAVLQHVPMREVPRAAQSVLNYVMRLEEPVVLANAAEDGAFTRDPYVAGARPRSILCLPLTRQGRLTGLLYLENNLASAAFTPGRVEVLKMLASEVVVAIENARLYRRLEDYSAGLERTVRDRTRELRDANRQLAAEKRKSEDLLLNVLPSKVAGQLRDAGRAEPESFEGVTVCFCDLVDFTSRSAGLEPRVLVDELNDLFTAFDNIVASHGCERIKTIGDAYLAVCGMPDPAPDHADRILAAAAGIVEWLDERGRRSPLAWKLRVGVHSGRVVGGVVGVRKYIYDVFGDTINTASRMESACEPGRINVSDATVAIASGRWRFEERPPVEVKGKGPMRMFWLRRDGPPDAGTNAR
ncbi:MAG: AAA family ATPase [Deltaproteobacteria bacterium]|nr:AAA family ATPase [Deltaproteobacteria bacterium]